MSYSSFNGQTISYDDSGNPTSYKGDTITWNGRLMTSYTKGNRRYEYSYNSDGMRTVKKIYENNELIYTYLYIWDGDVLLASRISTADSEEPTYVRYLYDESGADPTIITVTSKTDKILLSPLFIDFPPYYWGNMMRSGKSTVAGRT